MNKPTRILVVDDTLAVLQIFSRILRSRGYEVLEASTGAEGLKLARQMRPDLVVLDVIMPDISGIEVCRSIKTDPELVDVFVILASGEALSVPEKVGGLATGADDYVAKPVVVDEFLARVRTLLRLRDTTAALRASEQHYKRLVEVLPDAVCLLDLDGRVVTSNHRADEMIGSQSPAQMVGRQLAEIVHPSDLERFMAGMNETLQTGLTRNSEYTAVKKDGSSFSIELSAVLSSKPDGKPAGIVTVWRDVTEHKRSVGRIRELLHILNQAHDAISIWDLDGKIQYFNKGAERLFGWTVDEVRNRRSVDLFTRNPSQWAYGQEQLLQAGEWNGELTMQTKSGKTISVHSRWTVVQGHGDQSPHVLAIDTDITERKWAQNLLQAQRDFGIFLSSTNDLSESMERLLSISLELDGIDCGAVLMTEQGTDDLKLVVHHGFSKNFAYPFAGTLPISSDNFGSQEVDPMSQVRLDLKNEGLTAIEATPMRHGNRLVAILVLGSHAKTEIPARSWKAIEAIAAQAGDAIARILAEQSLRANRQLLEKTLHSLRSAVFIVDARTELIQDCNPSATRVFGYLREELIGQKTAMLHLNEASEKASMALVEEAVKTKGFSDGIEVMMKGKNGMQFPTEQSHMPIKLEGDQIWAWVTVISDITERKRAEKELRQLPLRIIQAQEAERLRVARELHDGVNQVIASAKMRLQKIADSIITANPVTREMLNRCYKMLVQALEENRRIAHNLRPSELDELGLTSACRNFCEQTESRTNLDIECSIPLVEQRVAPSVELNLFRILQEAMANIERHAEAKSVQVSLSFTGDSVTLRIQDDGCGFDSTKTKTNRKNLSGIGLTNIRERAASMGGTCDLKSAPNQGTTIIVHVPNASAKQA